MLGEQHRHYLKSIALYGLPLPPTLYWLSLWIAKTNDVELFDLLWRGTITYLLWLDAEFALLGRIPGFSPGAARGWAIAFYGLPMLPALYFAWSDLDITTNGQDFFGFLGWFFFLYFPCLGLEFLLLKVISGFTKTGMIFSAHDEAQQRFEDEQQIIVPHSARPPRGGWSEWRRR